MQSANVPVGKRLRYPGIEVLTADGKRRALLDQSDRPIAIVSATGGATGSVENITEVTDERGKGHVLDAVFSADAGDSLSELDLVGDADRDAGEVREIKERFNITTQAQEAGGFAFPTPVVEDIPVAGGTAGGPSDR